MQNKCSNRFRDIYTVYIHIYIVYVPKPITYFPICLYKPIIYYTYNILYQKITYKTYYSYEHPPVNKTTYRSQNITQTKPQTLRNGQWFSRRLLCLYYWRWANVLGLPDQLEGKEVEHSVRLNLMRYDWKSLSSDTTIMMPTKLSHPFNHLHFPHAPLRRRKKAGEQREVMYLLKKINNPSQCFN